MPHPRLQDISPPILDAIEYFDIEGDYMKRHDEFTFTIPNWNKYNPRKDYKSIPWVRLDSNIFDDPSYARLSSAAQHLFTFCLTSCARLNSTSCTVNVRLSSAKTHLTPKTIRNSLDDLETNQLVTVTRRSWDERRTFATKRNVTNVTKRTKRDEVDSTVQPSVDTPPPKIKSHWLVEIWNQKGKKLPPCRIPISESRLKKIKQRVKDTPLKEPWIEAIERLAISNFANGMNDRSWVASFDWIIKPDSLAKTLEGKYDNRARVDTKTQRMSDQWNRIERGEL